MNGTDLNIIFPILNGQVILILTNSKIEKLDMEIRRVSLNVSQI